MSEHLSAPEFDSHSYARPNQKWICGHAAEGKACRLGPSRRGRCQAIFECTPVLETKPGETKGRWRCTRPGDVCETGPRPDGTCCRPIPRCSPVPTVRTRRGRFTLAMVTATVALLLIVLGRPSLRTRFINPGILQICRLLQHRYFMVVHSNAYGAYEYSDGIKVDCNHLELVLQSAETPTAN